MGGERLKSKTVRKLGIEVVIGTEKTYFAREENKSKVGQF